MSTPSWLRRAAPLLISFSLAFGGLAGAAQAQVPAGEPASMSQPDAPAKAKKHKKTNKKHAKAQKTSHKKTNAAHKQGKKNGNKSAKKAHKQQMKQEEKAHKANAAAAALNGGHAG